jgi:hypothetical protein
LKILLIVVTLLLNLGAFYNPGHLLQVSTALFLFIIIISRRWDLFHFAFLIFIISLRDYFPAALRNIPSLQFLLPFVFSTIAILPFAQTRAALSWFRRGKIDRGSLCLMALTALVSTLALITWARWTYNLGVGLRMAREFSRFPGWTVLLLGVPLFALVNAFGEEAVYRGVMQEALSRVFLGREPLVLILQASAFAAIHFASGFPNGYIGYDGPPLWCHARLSPDEDQGHPRPLFNSCNSGPDNRLLPFFLSLTESVVQPVKKC